MCLVAADDGGSEDGCGQFLHNDSKPLDSVGVTSLESMYVTPDLSGVENEILGAAAQSLAWRRALAHKEGNSWSCAGIHRCPARCVLGQYPKLLTKESLCYSYKVND